MGARRARAGPRRRRRCRRPSPPALAPVLRSLLRGGWPVFSCTAGNSGRDMRRICTGDDGARDVHRAQERVGERCLCVAHDGVLVPTAAGRRFPAARRVEHADAAGIRGTRHPRLRPTARRRRPAAPDGIRHRALLFFEEFPRYFSGWMTTQQETELHGSILHKIRNGRLRYK